MSNVVEFPRKKCISRLKGLDKEIHDLLIQKTPIEPERLTKPVEIGIIECLGRISVVAPHLMPVVYMVLSDVANNFEKK